MNNKKRILMQWVQIVFGLLVFAFGVHLTIWANIGLAPWDCLGMGISYHTPLNYGLSMTTMAVIILCIDLLLKERIGFGTIIDALLTGNLVQMYNDLNPFPLNSSLWAGILAMLVGFVFMAVGMWLYMRCEQCCGPRDSLLVGIGKRMPKVPIGLVEILLWGVVLLAGWALGGPVGIGTVISTFGAGFVMQIVYNMIHFDPRNCRHRDVLEVSRELYQSA
jgi:uncharacterized membrane protein YczE